MDNIKNTIYGAMFGVAVGDALGAPLEFMYQPSIQQQYGVVRDMIGGGWLNVKPGEITDDTEMTLAVARGIFQNPKDPIVAIGRFFVDWANSGPKDIGATCASSIQHAISAAKKKNAPTKADWYRASRVTHNMMNGRSAGNGTLMRTAYVGLYYRDEQEAMRKAEQISKMTHWDDDTASDCAIYSAALSQMVNEDSLCARKQILIQYTSSRSNGRYSYDLLSRPGYAPRPTGYVVDSFAAALHCIYTTESFEAAVIKAVNLGGDADTIGAITGGLAGALYGYAAIPERWHGQLDATVRTNIDMLCAAAEAARMDA
ncbi:MAG: ADP-ribosylglycohydrolase family protein [Candidatus Fimadaptatus sp.]|jgi:ADP-ribosyl-[dinitrogen reductase] hydrolase